jgi:hypothetical protein
MSWYNNLAKKDILVLILSLTIISLLIPNGNAQGNIVLKGEITWDTYGIGRTCMSRGHNIFIADVDGDGLLEIITGGSSSYLINGERGPREAPLRLWNWNGNQVTLKASENWLGSIACGYAYDLTGDNVLEVITAGSCTNEAGDATVCLRVWGWTNKQLNLKAHYQGVEINSVAVRDLNNDGMPEIITVGRQAAQLTLCHYKDQKLSLVDSLDLDIANVTNANSVYASDLDNNGEVEIIVGGYSNNLNNSQGQLTVWHWDGQEFTLIAKQNWQLIPNISAKTMAGADQGNTIVNNVKADDLDGDGFKEIVTGGFTFDGEKVNAQVSIWHWSGNTLARINSLEWATDYLTEVKSLALNDADGDGRVDIVASGIAAAEDSFNNPEAPLDRGQLTVLGWNGKNMSLKEQIEWIFDDGGCAWNVGAGDLDNDGVAEIITAGCFVYNGTLCEPNMRIWSISQINNSIFWVYLITGIGAAITISIITCLYLKRKNKRAG